jgi:integrase
VRHSYATAALAAGVAAKVVSERLGHANIAITMDTYSHVLPGLDEQAAGQGARLIPWVLATRFRGCFVSKS